jgi:dTMP kinase
MTSPGASPPPRGALIVLEGADRSGKSTQAARLVAWLNGRGVRTEAWRFPDRGSAVGRVLDSYLKSGTELDDAAVHLLFSANRWEKRCAFARARRPRSLRPSLTAPASALLEQALREGTTLVVDRYAYSGVAFTAAKQLPGLDLEWCKARPARRAAAEA